MESAECSSIALRKQTNARELKSILNAYPHIKILSLDCFDTLLWRKTAAPKDVFYHLQHAPTFKVLGFAANLRIQAESKARRIAYLHKKTTEVSLKDIYRAYSSNLTEDEINKLEAEELLAEKNACYAFNETVNLIRQAHQRGLKVIIVSDTYLTTQQLTDLLKHTLPADVFAMLDHIFCSSEVGHNKSGQLFPLLLKTFNISPQYLLHIGDHPVADFSSPHRFNIPAIQLHAFNDEIKELLRMQTLAASFIDQQLRHDKPLPQPYAALLATHHHLSSLPALIGYATLGPILYAFAHFIRQEIKQLQTQHKKVKIAFLMRDAFLPMQIYQSLFSDSHGAPIHLSRFTAYAASFKTRHDIDSYLAERIQSGNFADFCRQLLLPKVLNDFILNKLALSDNPTAIFLHLIYQPSTLETIFKASAHYRVRLKKHLEKTLQLQSGDTLLFVDLGYTGTAQIKLQTIFKEEWQVEIVGCYLLALRTITVNLPRKGLIDTRYYDDKTLAMLVNYIALLEQLCTSNEKTVLDYNENGDPLFQKSEINQEQQEKRQAIQAECLAFAIDAQQFLTHPLNEEILRDTAAMSLCRFLFLPSKNELQFLKAFQFDFNLGTNKVIPIFDLEKGLAGVKKRGWLHGAKESTTNMRSNYPAEWRAISLELVLTLMAHHRFGLEIALNDLSHRRESITIYLLQNQQIEPITLEAFPTHDGYFSLIIPVINDTCKLAMHMGKLYQWVEFESAELIPLAVLNSAKENELTQDSSDCLMVEQMEDKGGGLFHCLSLDSLLIFSPKPLLNAEKHVLRLIFRPVVRQLP